MEKTASPDLGEDLVFICGALRSGTTLLRLMINAHPNLANPGEMDFLFEAPESNANGEGLAHYYAELAHNRVFKSQNLKIDRSLGPNVLVKSFVGQLRRPGARLTINIHRNFHRVPEVFPKARYVHLIRDPRDVAHSSIGMGWAGNVFHGVEHWINSEADFDNLAKKVPPAAIFTMRNEDLVREPVRELTRLCAFLGVAYDSRMLDYPASSTYGPPDPKLVEQWRKKLSPRELSLVEGRLGPQLEAKGYAPSGAPPVIPGIFERLILRQQNRAGRLSYSVKHNGAFLTALDLLSRVVPAPGLREFVRRGLGERAVSQLK